MMPLRSMAAASAIAIASAILPNHSLARPAEGTVLSLAIAPSSGRTEVVIGVSGDVTVTDFRLSAPERIVVDVANATLGLPVNQGYDRVARGAVSNVRYSQFKSDVVRIVLNLTEKRGYKVTRGADGVRVTLDDAAPAFEGWRIGGARVNAPVAPVALVAPLPLATVEVPETPVKSANVAASNNYSGSLTSPAVAPVRVITSVTQQQSQARRITITYPQPTPLTTIIKEFGDFGGVSIIPSKSVTGSYGPIQIENQPWDVALRAILNANGYDAYQDPTTGMIIVDTYESINRRETSAPLTTRRVELNYAKATTVAEMLKTQLSRDCQRTTTTTQATIPVPTGAAATAQPVPNQAATASQTVESLSCPVRGTALPDTITNAVQIIDVPSQMDVLEAFAKSLDIRPRQVTVKAKILSVDRSSLEGLGLRYDLGTANQFFNDLVPRTDSLGNVLTTAGQIALGGNALSAIANATLRVPGAAVQLVYSTALGGFDFSTFIEALQSTNVLDVMAEPQVTMSNNITSTLTAGTQVPIRVVDAGSATGSGNFARATVQNQQVGIILTVTPQITNNKQVKMKLHVENSSVQLVATDAGAVFPKEFVDTDVLVADGETIVISGLTQTEVRQTRSGIPFLVDLPIIGRLFGVTQRQETKRDLLIMITPHILDEGLGMTRDRQ